jgi:hypothetical protein
VRAADASTIAFEPAANLYAQQLFSRPIRCQRGRWQECQLIVFGFELGQLGQLEDARRKGCDAVVVQRQLFERFELADPSRDRINVCSIDSEDAQGT